MAGKKGTEIREFGDFQTPEELARQVTRLLRQLDITADYILEPTCGQGAFLLAAAEDFPEARRIFGFDINSSYVSEASRRVLHAPEPERVVIKQSDFFTFDWKTIFNNADLKSPTWLLLGNPPWVTNAELGTLQSHNLPQKSNIGRLRGIEAKTGKSNFDISEWMLLCYLDWLRDCEGVIAVLCKTAVARRVLARIWRGGYLVSSARLYTFDAAKYFSVAVDACLFVVEVRRGSQSQTCPVYSTLELTKPTFTIGYCDGFLLSDVEGYMRWCHLRGLDTRYTWRSGIKHDCSKVMELFTSESGLCNRLGEEVDIEEALLFPLLKGSDIGNRNTRHRGFMLVTQRTIGEDTQSIEHIAPKTWRYLQGHASLMGARRSSIYRNRPAFSIFGVGEYSFEPWKVAVSALHKNLNFVKVGPANSRPVVFDDTVYFLSCKSEAEADFLCGILNSAPAQEFFRSMIFWSDKRPITIDLLKRLHLGKLARDLGQSESYLRYEQPLVPRVQDRGQVQPTLF